MVPPGQRLVRVANVDTVRRQRGGRNRPSHAHCVPGIHCRTWRVGSHLRRLRMLPISHALAWCWAPVVHGPVPPPSFILRSATSQERAQKVSPLKGFVANVVHAVPVSGVDETSSSLYTECTFLTLSTISHAPYLSPSTHQAVCRCCQRLGHKSWRSSTPHQLVDVSSRFAYTTNIFAIYVTNHVCSNGSAINRHLSSASLCLHGSRLGASSIAGSSDDTYNVMTFYASW